MKVVLLIILFLISSQAFCAQELSYDSYEMAPVNLDHATRLGSFLSEQGFTSVANPLHGIPSLGINQVYFKDEHQFVMVKYGLKGKFPLDKIISTPTGFLVHQKHKDETLFLYFRGMNEAGVKLLLSRLKDKISSHNFLPLKSLLIQEAHAADDCGAGAMIGQMEDLTNLTAAMIWNFSKNCVSGLGAGAWDASGGMVVSGIKGIWSAISSPIDFVESTANSVRDFIFGVASFTKGLITDPRGTLNKVGAKIGGAWNSMTESVAAMSSDMKVQFICSLIGNLGMTGAIAVFTGGAGAAKFGKALLEIAQKMNLVKSMLSILSKISAAQKAALGLSPEKMKNFMSKLMGGKIPEEDLRHLEDMTNVDPSISTKVLACYI